MTSHLIALLYRDFASVTTVSGPACWAAGEVYLPGFKEGDNFLPGFKQADVYNPGFVEGQESCD